MRILFGLALAYQVSLAINPMSKLDGNAEFHILDYLCKGSRRSYATTSKLACTTMAKYSKAIDIYISLFDYPIQAANGCITRNKLRGMDPVDCIVMVTNSVQNDKLAFHDSYRQSFSNAQLEVLIFNAIEIRNIPVLEDLLWLRSSTGDIEWVFLQNAYCWALVSEKFYGPDYSPPTSVKDFPVNTATKFLDDFATLREFDITLSTTITFDSITMFYKQYEASNQWLTLGLAGGGAYFFKLFSERPYPTSQFELDISEKHLKFLSEKGALFMNGCLCSAVQRSAEKAVIIYLKSGLKVNWDSEMRCIASRLAAKDPENFEKKTAIVRRVIYEMKRQFYPQEVPQSIFDAGLDQCF